MEEGDWTTQNGAQTRHTFEIIGLVGFYCLVLASSLNSMFLLLPVFCSQSPCCHRDRLIPCHVLQRRPRDCAHKNPKMNNTAGTGGEDIG